MLSLCKSKGMVPPTANPDAAGSSADAGLDEEEGPAVEDPYNVDDAGSQKNRVSVFPWVGIHRFL